MENILTLIINTNNPEKVIEVISNRTEDFISNLKNYDEFKNTGFEPVANQIKIFKGEYGFNKNSAFNDGKVEFDSIGVDVLSKINKADPFYTPSTHSVEIAILPHFDTASTAEETIKGYIFLKKLLKNHEGMRYAVNRDDL